MIVKEIVTEAIRYYVEGSGYIPKGKFAIIQDNDKNNNINSMYDINNNTIVNVASYPILEECLIAEML